MFFKNILMFYFLLDYSIYVDSFSLKNEIIKHNRKNNLKMIINSDYFNDLNLIHKSKFYFEKDNYNDVIENLLNNKITKIFINTDYKELVSIDNIQDDTLYNHYHLTSINPIVVPNLVQKASEMHIPLYFVNFTPESMLNFQNIINQIVSFSTYSIPVIFLISFLLGIYQRSQINNIRGGQNRGLNNNMFMPFGNKMNKKDDITTLKNQNISLSNWAGSPEVIDECKEVISYLENKELYKKIGAEMPKGILLEGPPGTGKTLLAKAIASETNSSFISTSGSEFVELFVGIGASRVRELFENARQNKPAIIFIDEIDAVGRQRGAGINMANDEREQTLNQILYEMDGFNDNEDIVVMAATNRKDVLDQALLRPGRFDRIIKIPLPDKDSREKILDYYLKNKKIDKNFDISAIAELTDGFSGAQLKNLINEAAIISAKNKYTVIQEKYIFDAFEKSIVGLIKTNATVAPVTRHRVAIHETGHTLLTLKFREYFDFKKVSIQPTYNGAGGYTIFSEKPEIKEGGLYTKDMFKKRLIVSMGGKAAESIMYGNDFVSLGAIEDLRQANKLAQRMIGNFGMGEKLEVFFNEDVSDDSNPFLGRSLSVGSKYSQYTKYIMDKESLELVKEAYSEAKKILLENKDKIMEFADLLEKNTILYNKDIQDFHIL